MVEQLDAFVDDTRDSTATETVTVIGLSLGATGVRYYMHCNDRY